MIPRQTSPAFESEGRSERETEIFETVTPDLFPRVSKTRVNLIIPNRRQQLICALLQSSISSLNSESWPALEHRTALALRLWIPQGGDGLVTFEKYPPLLCM